MKGGKELSILIDHREVCRMLGIKTSTWHTRLVRGQVPVPHSVMGHTSYYRRADIDHFLRKGSWPARMKFRGRRPAVDAAPGEGDEPAA